MIYSYNGFIPVVHESAYIHPQAVVSGHVIIGKDVYIGPCAVLRGDWGGIHIGDGCNVQENCTIHMFPGIVTRLEEEAHIGHGAVIHGSHIGHNCMVGMNAVIMDRVHLGEHSIVGALSFVKEGSEIPPRSLVVGNPARIVKEVSDEMIEWKKKGTQLYQNLAARMQADYHLTEPLREIPENLPKQEKLFENWTKIKNENQ